MMDKGDLNDDNALSYHLRFFDVDRQQQLENVDRAARSKVELDDKYDNEFMENTLQDKIGVTFIIIRANCVDV